MIVQVKISTPFGENVLNMEEQAAKELLNDFINRSASKRPADDWHKDNAPQPGAYPKRQPTPSAKPKITTRPQGSRNASLFGADWREQARASQLPTESGKIAPRGAQRATRGFMICECESCGSVRAFCSKKPLDYNVCSVCGHRTTIKDADMKIAYADCACGEKFRYHTNANKDQISITCIHCGRKIRLRKNYTGQCYVTEKGGSGNED